MTTTKKTPTKKVEKTEEVEAVTEPTAEEIREQELTVDELLADLPELRPPHLFMMRHKHALIELADKLNDSKMFDKSGRRSGIKGMLNASAAVAAIEDFALSIAADPAEFEAWAIEHNDDYDAFLAIFFRYQSALGE